MIFLGCFAYDNSRFFSLVVQYSEVVFEFQRRATDFGSLRAKHILAPLGMPKGVILNELI